MSNCFVDFPIYGKGKLRLNKIINGIEYKICLGTLCNRDENKGLWKPLKEFTKSKNSKDGHFYKCRDCKSYDNHPDSIKERKIINEKNKYLTEKVCRLCNNTLKLDFFGKRKKSNGEIRYTTYCKECRNRKILKNNPKKHPHEYRNGVLGRICNVCKEWKTEDECYKRGTLLRDECIQCKRKYSQEFMKKLKTDDEKYRKYLDKKVEFHKNNIHAKISGNLRTRMRSLVIKENSQDKTSYSLVGIGVKGLRKYLESKFLDGMSWENYGTKWHIDHIIPCASFNLSRKDEQKRCFNYLNLQPLWSSDNLIKGNKYKFNPVLEIKLYNTISK